MVRFIVCAIAALFRVEQVEGQISFSEKRQRDKAHFEGVKLILEGDLEMASVLFTESLEIDSTYAPAYLQRGRIMI